MCKNNRFYGIKEYMEESEAKQSKNYEEFDQKEQIKVQLEQKIRDEMNDNVADMGEITSDPFATVNLVKEDPMLLKQL